MIGGQDRLRRLPVGMRVEIQNDAMAQNGGRDVLHIVDRKMKTPAHQRQHAAAFHQRLRAARRTAVADVFLRQLVRLRLLGLRGHHQLDGVFLDVRRHQHLAADRAHFHDRLAIHHRHRHFLFPLDGALHDPVQLVAARDR